MESLQMKLSTHFYISYDQMDRIHTLEKDKRYLVLYARRLSTQYGSTVRLTL